MGRFSEILITLSQFSEVKFWLDVLCYTLHSALNRSTRNEEAGYIKTVEKNSHNVWIQRRVQTISTSWFGAARRDEKLTK
jgi:hypothetical protein